MKKFILFIFFILLSSNAFAWGNGYYGRTVLIISGNKVSTVSGTALTNFPMLVSGTYAYLATVANGGYVINTTTLNSQTVPADVIFTSDPQGATLLNWDVELYTASSGLILAHVQVPSLSPSQNTVIYMFYGNPSVTTYQGNASSTWDSNFKGIYHLNDNAANTTVISSAGINNATNVANTSTKTTTGQIGSALTYNGSTDKSTTPDIATLDNGAAVTFSGWVKFTALSDFGGIVTKGNAAGTQRITLQLGGSGAGANTGLFLGAGLGASTTYGTTASSLIATGNWYHVAVVFDGSQSTNPTRLKAYINGANVSLSFSGTIPATVANTTDPVVLGADRTNFMNGILDEARVSNLVRSADWVVTEYNSQSSPSTFYSIGNPIVINNANLSNITIQ